MNRIVLQVPGLHALLDWHTTSTLHSICRGNERRYLRNMRTTIDIDPDVFQAAETIASKSSRSIGEIISALLRKALKLSSASPAIVNGFEVIPAEGRIVTPELIERLMEEADAA